MEGVVSNSELRSVFHKRRVLVTGHTGFKGAWLSRWLLELGADVSGYSLPEGVGPPSQEFPPGVHSLFEELELRTRIDHREGDITELQPLCATIQELRPDFVFHLAAQSLVRLSYRFPVETFQTNLLGTIHVFEALRQLSRPVVCINVTSDKCYHNQEREEGYHELDRLGGDDPYSCSKAMSELATETYRQSFFGDGPIKLASARAGNVIGGGDWAVDRIVPDCIRALIIGQPIVLRNPSSMRPWQHVLEPLGGYLRLAAAVSRDSSKFCAAFNFGPAENDLRTVDALVREIVRHWPGEIGYTSAQEPIARETQRLSLNVRKAEVLLNWRVNWNVHRTVAETVDWYRRHHAGVSAEQLTIEQIRRYAG